ncbi:hypothetical protein [Flavobacterium sp. WV_118_3]|uniref:hypothetical protein n=1 Tax=Flavobacterium sp. WV_118_3 TaxID=3151764 RepID=UPI0032192ABD
MKHLFIVVLATGLLIFYGSTIKKRRSYIPEIKSTSDTTKMQLNGVYSLYDISKGNDSIEAFKRYVYISPILFLKNDHFIQSPHSDWVNSNLIKEIKNNNVRLDYGKYYFSRDTIHLEGLFTFFTTGMDWRQYPANYTGYLDSTGDTLYLKLAKPFPKINMKLNRHLAKRIREAPYQKYIFKPLPKDDIPVDIDIDDLFPIQKKKKRTRH